MNKDVEIELRSIAICTFNVCVFEVLQFKATVWPEVASESTYEAQIFWGSTPQTPLVASAFRTASWAGAGYEATRKRSVSTLCPDIGCVLATPLLRPLSALSETKPRRLQL